MATTSLNLGPHWEQFIREQVATGGTASTERVRRAKRGRIAELNRMRSPAALAPRSRTLARRTATGPIAEGLAAVGDPGLEVGVMAELVECSCDLRPIMGTVNDVLRMQPTFLSTADIDRRQAEAGALNQSRGRIADYDRGDGHQTPEIVSIDIDPDPKLRTSGQFIDRPQDAIIAWVRAGMHHDRLDAAFRHGR